MKNYNTYIDDEFLDSDESNDFHGGKVKFTKKKTKIKDELTKTKNKKLNKPKHINKIDF